MKHTENSEDQDPLRSILAKLIPKQLAPATCHESLFIHLQEVMDYVQNIIETIEVSGQSPAISCTSGCSYCCHSQVSLIPVEALFIHSFVQTNFNGPAISLLKERVERSMGLTQGKTEAQKYAMKKQTPCIFLKDKTCSIYAVRPFICRSWNSLDRLDCISAFNSMTPDGEIETSPARNYVFSTARQLFQDVSQQMDLETAPMEITHALFNCLNLTAPLTHWLAGGLLSSLSPNISGLPQG